MSQKDNRLEPKWYVVHTYSGYENKVKTDLEKTIKNIHRYGSKAIITEAVFDKLKDTFVCRELDFITVKGKTEPVRIYEILQLKTKSSAKLLEIKTLFERGLYFYRKKQWEKSSEYFMACYKKYNDMPSKIFIDRIRHFKISPPPAKWDGVFEMRVK